MSSWRAMTGLFRVHRQVEPVRQLAVGQLHHNGEGALAVERRSHRYNWRITIRPSENDYEVLARRMLPGQNMVEFIEANCDELDAARAGAA